MLQAIAGEPRTGPNGKRVVELACGHLSYYAEAPPNVLRWCYVCQAELEQKKTNGKKKGNKYGAKRVTVDGRRFDSQREAKRYQELKALERDGQIRNLELQPKFELHATTGKRVARYIADFRYVDRETGQTVVEDAKGYRTRHYKHKRKHVEAEYGIQVIEV